MTMNELPQGEALTLKSYIACTLYFFPLFVTLNSYLNVKTYVMLACFYFLSTLFIRLSFSLHDSPHFLSLFFKYIGCQEDFYWDL